MIFKKVKVKVVQRRLKKNVEVWISKEANKKVLGEVVVEGLGGYVRCK